jgi:hypothetical protein
MAKRSAIRKYRETNTHMEIVGSTRNESEISEKKEHPASPTIVGIEKENCYPGRKIRPGAPGKVTDRSSGGNFRRLA